MTERFAIVTGCAGGLGQAFCRSFDKAGYRVIGTDKRVPADRTGLHDFLLADVSEIVTDQSTIDNFRDRVSETTDGTPISVLINNAAIQILGNTEDISLSDFRHSLEVNIAAPFALARAFLADLRQTNGTVINIGSVHTQATKPRFVAYATSKAAIDGLTRALAVDLGPDVRVVALAPAAVDTEMLRAGFEGNPEGFAALEAIHPSGRIAQPDEIADLGVFLASEAAGFMTGTTVYADGGILSRLHDPA
ncbi:MAG: SDR family oxidoreductase [Pseudomonadota bacterium]